MAITGTHALLYTSEPEELRGILRDSFGFEHVDAGDGWLIFKLPPAEVGVHPGESPSHVLSFMCDDIKGTIAELRAKGLNVDENTTNAGYGIATTIHLPGGVDVQLYEPRHATAI